MTKGSPSLFHQAQVVREASLRAHSSLKDSLAIWSEGDWRVQELVHRAKYLDEAFETLSNLHAAEGQKYTYDKDRRTLVPAVVAATTAPEETK